jgi:hypothetical protein
MLVSFELRNWKIKGNVNTEKSLNNIVVRVPWEILVEGFAPVIEPFPGD